MPAACSRAAAAARAPPPQAPVRQELSLQPGTAVVRELLGLEPRTGRLVRQYDGASQLLKGHWYIDIGDGRRELVPVGELRAASSQVETPGTVSRLPN